MRLKARLFLTQYLVAVEDPVAAIPLGVRPHTLKITEKIEVTSLRQHITDKRLIGSIWSTLESPDLPAPGSVMAIALMHFPAVISGMKRSICSLLP